MSSYDEEIRKIEESELIPTSAIMNQIDPGNIVESSSRPQSAASNVSQKSWTSGKSRRAPAPPSRSINHSMTSIDLDDEKEFLQASTSRRTSCCSRKRPQTLRERFHQTWHDPGKQKQILIWIFFIVIVLVTVISLSILVVRFTSGFSSRRHRSSSSNQEWAEEEGDTEKLRGEGQRYRIRKELIEFGKRIHIAVSDNRVRSSKPIGEGFLMLIGGDDEERKHSCEILSRSGICHMIEGYPSPLPSGRTGHMAAISNGKGAVVCGGIEAKSRKLSKECWLYDLKNNMWKQIPGLIQAVRYGSGTSIRDAIFMTGGTNKDGKKTNQVQVMDIATKEWVEGPPLPQNVWGHCAAATIKGEIIVTGGWTDSAVRSNMRNTFSLKKNSVKWNMLDTMHIGRATHGCAASEIKTREIKAPAVIVAGGMNFRHLPIAEVEVLLLTDNPRWVKKGTLNRPRTWYPAVGVLNNKLIVAAGKGMSGAGEDSVEYYNPKLGTWNISSITLQWRRFDGRSLVVPSNWFPNCVR